jgi:NTE family protein
MTRPGSEVGEFMRAGGKLSVGGWSMLVLAAGGAIACVARADDPVPPAPAQAAIASGLTPAPHRPRIGLVLGGGGAKGAAHVGVITLLEELRIPIDCVVGASVGALVGGTYASGQTAAELEQSIRSISWADTIAFKGYRQKLPMRRKIAGVTYSNSLQFGFKDGRVTAPHGFINSQNVEQTIKSLVSRSLGESDFDRLPIPFRAVATDMQTGDMVVLSHGDLAQAMRASMAVPGVFAPVTIDDKVLGDGGLTRNLPVDIARQTCADVVIAVSVPNPPPTAEELQSPLTMVSRTVDVLIEANEKQQLATLGPQDVSIVVPMGTLTSSAFDKVSEAIPLGHAAAEAHRAELMRYSLPANEYAAWRNGHSRASQHSVRLAGVKIEGLERVSQDYVRSYLGLDPGQQVGQRQVAQAMDRVFALDDFESVQYELQGDPANPTLAVQLKEKASSPNILRFDLGLEVGTDGNTAFSLGGDYLRPWINSLGGEVHGHLQLGGTSNLGLSLFQPLDDRHQWFVEPGIYAERSLQELYYNGDSVSRYEFEGGYGFLDAGREFGTRSELRAGVRYGAQAAKRDIAVPQFPEVDAEGYAGWTLGFTYDDRDAAALATRGWLARLRYYRSEESLGAAQDYDRLEGMVVRSVPLWGNLLYLRGMGGTSFGTQLPLYDTFSLGGPASLPGLSTGQLRGDSYWAVTSAYLHKIGEINPLYGQALYLGLSLTAADMSGRIDTQDTNTIYSGAIVFGGRTPLGPLTLSLGVATTNDWQIVLGLGRPVEERNVSDPVW